MRRRRRQSCSRTRQKILRLKNCWRNFWMEVPNAQMTFPTAKAPSRSGTSNQGRTKEVESGLAERFKCSCIQCSSRVRFSAAKRVAKMIREQIWEKRKALKIKNGIEHIFRMLYSSECCTEWDSNPRVQSTLDQQFNSLTTRPPRHINNRL